MNQIFSTTSYTVSQLLEKIYTKELGLPELQRTFVWKDQKVRDLFDSMINCFVIRNKNNKWFGLVMKVPCKKFNLNKEDLVDVLNVKIDDHGLYDIVVDNKTIFPGYHMAKHKWISILLDGSVDIKKIFKLIDESYITVDNK